MKVEIVQNAAIDIFNESLHSYIMKAFELKEWKKYQNFNIYVSLKGLGNNICIVQPSAFGYLHGNYNPCAFVGIPISRKTYKV